MVELAYGVDGWGLWARLTTQNKKGVISYQSRLMKFAATQAKFTLFVVMG
jgi:hypothetical protein